MSLRVRFCLATLLVGVAAGLAGVVLTLLLHLVQHTLFGYTEDTFLIGVEHASRARRIWAPALGGLVTGLGWWWLGRSMPHGALSIPAALRSGERLPVGKVASDSLLQIVAVGAGASMGREGAPRQAGAALAGLLGDRLRLTADQRRTLVACGAGAGLAAVYNVPFGGTLFTLEILLVSARPRHVLPAFVTSAVATVVSWPFLGDRPVYRVVAAHLSWQVLVCAVVLGPVTGALGTLFSSTMAKARTEVPRTLLMVPAIVGAFALTGLVAGWYPELLGNGKGLAQVTFAGSLTLAVALALVVIKPAAAAVSLSSGAVGGLLTPAFATGAALGLATGLIGHRIWSGTPAADVAIVGATAFLAVTQRAPLTATVLTLEWTRCGAGLLPAIVLAVALGILASRAMRPRVRGTRDTESVEPALEENVRTVVAGAIVRRNADGARVLAARRSRPAEVAGRWELPGGKVEPGETPEEALVRELGEELGVRVEVASWLDGESPIRDGMVLRAAVVRETAGEPRPAEGGEHDAVRWLEHDELAEVDWLEPDRPFLAELGGVLRGEIAPGHARRAVVFDEDDARRMAARLAADGWWTAVRRERFANEDDDEDHPWAVETDAPEFVVELLVDEFDGWLDLQP